MSKSINNINNINNTNNTNNKEFVNYINDLLSESPNFSKFKNDIFNNLIVPPGYYVKNIQPNLDLIDYSNDYSNDECSHNKCIDNKIVDGFINLVSINNKSKNKTRRKKNIIIRIMIMI